MAPPDLCLAGAEFEGDGELVGDVRDILKDVVEEAGVV
jgi:hypothetical protein